MATSQSKSRPKSVVPRQGKSKISSDDDGYSETSSSSEEDLEEEETINEEVEEVVSEEEQYPDRSFSVPGHVFEALCDFTGEEEGDLSFKSGDLLTVLSIRDDGWWEAANAEGCKGLIPSTYMKMCNKNTESNISGSNVPQKKSVELWHGIQKALKEPSAPDVLSALDALPSGFQTSYLSKLLEENDNYSTSSYLVPKLSNSGLSFYDIFWDPVKETIKPCHVKIERLVTIIACRKIPLPSVGTEVLSQHVYLCLHDGDKVLSNIHIVRTKLDPKNPEQWSFSSKLSQGASGEEESQCFVRTSNTSTTVGIIFEPCLKYKSLSTGEEEEVSCGWVFVRLLDDSGRPVANVTKAFHIHGGNPFEKDILVNPSHQKNLGNSLKALILKTQEPRLVIRLSEPRGELSEQLSFLPDMLIGPKGDVSLLTVYRHCLAETIAETRLGANCADSLHSPLLNTFPQLLKRRNIFDLFKNKWIDILKSQKRNIRKDMKKQSILFTQVFLEKAYIITHCDSMSDSKLSNSQVEEINWKNVNQLDLLCHERGPLGIALSSYVNHSPFEIDELTLDIVRNSFPSEECK
ncbi:nephrocystin-1-like [Tachypleus tridentatus]|uniref:nephrocystin-1-like n=1 Tax=Tachypleus tridentatus TaxID=6853 RepID=UPI003FCFA75F